MERKLRILHICSSRAWGGGEISAVKLAKSFIDRGHKVFFAAHPKGKIIEECKSLGIRTFCMTLLRNIDLVSSYRLRRIIKKYNVDVIHVHLSRDLVHAYFAIIFLRNAPKIIFQKQVSSKVIKRDLFHRLIYSKVDKIFVLSNFLRNNILDTCPVDEKIVTVIPGGIDVELYNQSKEVRNKIRAEWQISEKVLVIGTISRIDRAKGLVELVTVYADLLRSFDKSMLVIVGEPTHREEEFDRELKELIEELGIGKKVIFTGYRRDIPQILSAFDIFALPSYEEAFGYVYIEAMAAGLPVIAADCGGVRDIIENQVNGMLVPPRDTDRLFESIKLLAQDGVLRNKLGEACKSHVKIKFSEKKILEMIEAEYYNMILK